MFLQSSSPLFRFCIFLCRSWKCDLFSRRKWKRRRRMLLLLWATSKRAIAMMSSKFQIVPAIFIKISICSDLQCSRRCRSGVGVSFKIWPTLRATKACRLCTTILVNTTNKTQDPTCRYLRKEWQYFRVQNKTVQNTKYLPISLTILYLVRVIIKLKQWQSYLL